MKNSGVPILLAGVRERRIILDHESDLFKSSND